MATEVIMPKMGEVMEEGRIVKWLKKEGEFVERGEPIFEIETDKSVICIESRVSGVLLKIAHSEGDVVPIMGVVAYIGNANEKIAETAMKQIESEDKKGGPYNRPEKETIPTAVPANVILATPYARKLAGEKGVELGVITGTGEFGAIVASDVLNYAGQRATPLAHKIARDINIDLASIQGSGYNGKIFKDDIIAAQNAKIEVPPKYRKPLTGMKKVIADRMYQSHAEIPDITLYAKADVTELLSLREEINKKQTEKITINDFIIKAACIVLKELPIVNSCLEGNEIVYKEDINIGIAVAVEEGLIVPNIKGADHLSLKQLSAKSKELSSKARNGQLMPEDYAGGTFTISNLGMYGITFFNSIINQPEAAILGVCAAEDQLVMVDEKIEARKFIGLCFNFDHRIMYGADGAAFLKRLGELLENPLQIII